MLCFWTDTDNKQAREACGLQGRSSGTHGSKIRIPAGREAGVPAQRFPKTPCPRPGLPHSGWSIKGAGSPPPARHHRRSLPLPLGLLLPHDHGHQGAGAARTRDVPRAQDQRRTPGALRRARQQNSLDVGDSDWIHTSEELFLDSDDDDACDGVRQPAGVGRQGGGSAARRGRGELGEDLGWISSHPSGAAATPTARAAAGRASTHAPGLRVNVPAAACIERGSSRLDEGNHGVARTSWRITHAHDCVRFPLPPPPHARMS